jgi:sugar phosphate isomerase/epimerase
MRSRSTRTTRREFLVSAAAAASALCVPLAARAAASSVGLQLYTASDALAENFEGTLQAIRDIGYRDVETAGALHRSAGDWLTGLKNAGLHCTSVHLVGDDAAPKLMDFAKELRADYVVTALYLLNPTPDDAAYRKMLSQLTLDDYKRMAEQCNRLGEHAQQRQLKFAYHNENMEFEPKAGRLGYDILLSETDRRLVKFELDCGWMVAAGHHPVEYLQAHPDRYRLLHIKDFEPITKPTYGLAPNDAPHSTELGRGIIDYRPIIDASRRAGVDHYFVEEEPPFSTPVMQALGADFDYAKTLLSH